MTVFLLQSECCQAANKVAPSSPSFSLFPTIRRTTAWLDHFSAVILTFVPFSVLVWWNKNGRDTLTSNFLSCLNLFRFSDMRLDDDNGIPTQEFLDSCYAIVPVLGRPSLSRHSSSYSVSWFLSTPLGVGFFFFFFKLFSNCSSCHMCMQSHPFISCPRCFHFPNEFIIPFVSWKTTTTIIILNTCLLGFTGGGCTDAQWSENSLEERLIVKLYRVILRHIICFLSL